MLALLLVSIVMGNNYTGNPVADISARPAWIRRELKACDILDDIVSSDARKLYEIQGLVHCHEKNLDVVPCHTLEFARHSRRERIIGNRTFIPRPTSLVINAADHYYYLMRDTMHSIHRINKKVVPWKISVKPEYIWADITFDVRCFHSWTVNPFHRHSDCLTFIIPAFHYYLQYGLAETSILLKRSRKTELPRFTNTHMNNNRIHVLFMVDEATDNICRPSVRRAKEGNKIFNLHRDLEDRFGDIFAYNCLYTSNYFASPNWFKNKANTSIVTGEYVYLAEQKNPFTAASGYHAPGAGVASPRNRYYNLYLREYRRILFNAFCTYCHVGVPHTAANLAFHSAEQHDTVLLISRKQKMSRFIPQMNELADAVQVALRNAPTKYNMMVYKGHENMCEVIDMFWHAKVIIAAHGAGIINTIFSRPDSLLIEITVNSLDPSKRGVPWRSNGYIAQIMNVSVHVLVVPHNESATSDRDLQMRYPLELTQSHISFVANVVKEYLVESVSTGSDQSQTMNITSMV